MVRLESPQEVQPQDIRPLISRDEMHSQASATTRAALAQLQHYIKAWQEFRWLFLSGEPTSGAIGA